MNKLCFTLIFAFVFSVASRGQNNAPKIIETTPEFGDCQVDPQLEEIVIRFDQDMGKLYSVTNSPNMPEITGKPVWKDQRTLVLPVKLERDRFYDLNFNSIKYQGFRSEKGVALDSDQLLFLTIGERTKAPNKKSFQQFTDVFPGRYSYANIQGVDWQKEIDNYKTVLENAESVDEFVVKLIQLLRKSQDPHMSVKANEQIYPINRMKIVHLNFGSKALFGQLQNKFVGNRYSTIAGTIDSTAYLSIRSWSSNFFEIPQKKWGNTANNVISSQELLKTLFKYPNLIIDVRENSGGDEQFAMEFASWFTADPLPYEKTVTYNMQTGTFNAERIKTIFPNSEGLLYTGNVYVLAGPKVMSSNESFVLMMQQLPNVKVVGMPTYGSSGNPLPYELANGVTVYLPSWLAYTIDGKLIEGNGIEPDVLIETKDGDFQNSDVVVDAVLKMIE
ncbi:MAG: S41 family peptidase [Prolixibacteraceae bacterium]